MDPEQVVRAELESWSALDVEQIAAHFAPDAGCAAGWVTKQVGQTNRDA